MFRRTLLVAEACVCAFVVRVCLRAGSIRTAAWAARRAPLPRVPATHEECDRAAAIAARYAAHPTCLYRALTAYGMIARRERDVRFHLGAANRDGVAAHAWVAVDGRSLDRESEAYLPLWTES